MYSIDANILIFSVMKDGPFYERSRNFLISRMNENEPVFFCWETIYAFIRITTNRRIMKNPLSFREANQRANLLIERQNVSLLHSTKESYHIFQEYEKNMKLEGNLISDAIIASQLESNGIKKIYTNDKDFWKFPQLRPVDPLM